MARKKIINQKAEEIIVDSSFIRRIVYFWGTGQLMIFIKSNLYIYYKIEAIIYVNLREAESKGSYYNAYIKGKYNEEKY